MKTKKEKLTESEEESAIAQTGAESETRAVDLSGAVALDKSGVCDNLLVQMIYRIVFCCVSALGCILSFGYFTEVHGTDTFTISDDFWQYYTNLSNYYCFVIGVLVCSATVKRVFAGETRGYNRCVPTLKFCGVVMIMVTFFVYLILLGDVASPAFWNSLGNLCYHVAAPVLFIVDWFIFDEHKKVKALDPLKTLVMPLFYVAYILIYGAVCRAVGADFSYPYFFLNVDKLGYGGVFLWVAILLVVFTVLGYLLFVYDKLVKRGGRWKLDFQEIRRR